MPYCLGIVKIKGKTLCFIRPFHNNNEKENVPLSGTQKDNITWAQAT